MYLMLRHPGHLSQGVQEPIVVLTCNNLMKTKFFSNLNILKAFEMLLKYITKVNFPGGITLIQHHMNY